MDKSLPRSAHKRLLGLCLTYNMLEYNANVNISDTLGLNTKCCSYRKTHTPSRNTSDA